MQAHVEEVIEVAHVQLQPVHRCVQICLHALNDHLEIPLLLQLDISGVAQNRFEQAGESLQKHVP